AWACSRTAYYRLMCCPALKAARWPRAWVVGMSIAGAGVGAPGTNALTISAIRAEQSTSTRRQRSMDADESFSGAIDQTEAESGEYGWEEPAGVRRTLYLPAELSRTLAEAAQAQ